ncbi:MAG: hypothetical protein ACRECT_06820 [Thermoplasmata archaeon]
MKQLVRHLPRVTFWVVVLLLLAGSLATMASGAQGASSPNYTLTGYARQPGSSGAVPNGAQVDLVSRTTGAVFTTTTFGGGGQFNFTTARTGGALVPGHWGVWIPAQGNLSTPGCKLCTPFGVYPASQNPQFYDLNASALTTTRYPTTLYNVTVVSYTAILSGTVKSSGAAVGGAQVQLLYPEYANYVLVSNTTAANGTFSMKVPAGSWVLRTTSSGATPLYNLTALTIAGYSKPTVTISLNSWLFSGYVDQASGGGVPSGGNVTLWDGTNSYIYSNPTPPGGFYSIGAYPAGFSGTTGQSFDVVLSTVGFVTTTYTHVSSGSSYSQNVISSPMTAAERGIYTTTLNFSSINIDTGVGTLSVETAAALGNDTVFSNLPNASIGQMWGQLGLDFNHQPSFPSTMLSSLYAWENASGPFYSANQGAVAINGTTFLPPSGSGNLQSPSSTCTGTCGLTSPYSINLGWSQQYTLNGTLFRNASSYTLSFGFAHPLSSDTYNYTVVLPSGYVLGASSSPPAQTRLVAAGPSNTWSSFTVQSLPSSSPTGTASFTIVRSANLTVNVNASVPNFAFSNGNVLNRTHNNYTVVVGVGQNVTFTGLNSTYPAGTNGTGFAWAFGDGATKTTTTPTTNHTYTAASGATPYAGTLSVTASGGQVNSTTFFVWVGSGPVTAVVSSNASASQNRSSGGTPYAFVNWGTVLYFNASASSAQISPTAPITGPLSVASYAFTARGFRATQNYSVGQGAYFGSNWSYQFLGAGVYYQNHTTIGGAPVYFLGWQYNLTLTVWDATGQSATTSLIVLVNDTQAPASRFQILNSAGKPVTGSGVLVAANLTAKVYLDGANATDPNNGSLTRYYWLVSNSGNTSVHIGINQTTVKPYPTLWLAPQQSAYTVNLTVFDLNNNKGWTTQSLSVTVNSTLAVIMAANNLTGPGTIHDGTTYTYWVNVTSSGGTQSVAQNVRVTFYLTSPSGTSRSYIAGTPASVVFFNYTSPGVVNNNSFASGSIGTMAYNVTYRAVITWTPARTGNFDLWANVTASNEYAGTYPTGPQTKTIPVTINPNPTTQLIEYAVIVAAVIIVILAIVIFYRRRGRRGAPSGRTAGRGGLERARSKSDDEDDEA